MIKLKGKKISPKSIRSVKNIPIKKAKESKPSFTKVKENSPVKINKTEHAKKKKTKSIVKSMGVKSIHYLKDENSKDYNLYLENGLKLTKAKAKKISNIDNVLAKVKFDNVDTLNSLEESPEVYIKDPSFNIRNSEARGFTISRTKGESTSITNVVQDSFISNLIHQKDERLKLNNIDIQLFHNCLDLKKIIGLYINDIILGIQSRKIDVSDNFADIISQSRNTRTKLLLKNDNSYLEDLYRLYYIFRSYSIKELLDLHKNSKETITHDIINLLSDFRNFSAHSENKISSYQFFDRDAFDSTYIQELFDIFIEKFKKTNFKTMNILSAYYGIDSTTSLESYKKLGEEYFEFVLEDKTKNFDISIDKVQKIIFDEYRFKEILEVTQDRNTGEILNKLKSSIKFIVYRYYSNEGITDLETFKEKLVSSIDKLETYKTDIVPKILSSKVIDIDKLLKIIKANVGDNNPINEIVIDYKIEMPKDHIFIDYLFVLSLFLTTKNANSFFSDILTKYESIIDLLKLRTSISNDGYAFKIKETELNNVLNVLPVIFDFTDYFYDENYIYSLTNKILLMKGLRSKFKKEKSTIVNTDFNYIYNSIPTEHYNFKKYQEELELKSKTDHTSPKNKNKAPSYPLRNFIRNQIYNSKYYEYISSFVGANFVSKIMKSKATIRLVLNTIYSNYKDVANDFLIKSYTSFKRIDSGLIELTNSQIEELIDAISNLTLDKISDSIFNKTKLNYTSLVKLYYFVAYLIVKNLVSINSSYYIAYLDFENYRDMLINVKGLSSRDTKSNNLLLFNEAISYYEKKKSTKTYKQLKALKEGDNFKPFFDINYSSPGNDNTNCNYSRIHTLVRNHVEHLNILNANYLNIHNIDQCDFTSYFDLYSRLMQSHFKDCEGMNLISIYGENHPLLKKISPTKPHSTTINTILYLPLAYNISRFNKLTVEKYAIAERGKSAKVNSNRK